MNFDYKLYKKILLALGILSPLAFGLRIFSYWNELDAATGFFSGNGAGSFVFNLICFAVFFLCLILTYRKKGSFPESFDDAEEEQNFFEFFFHGFTRKCATWFGTFSAFAALLPGFGLIAHALSFILEKENLTDAYAMLYALLALTSGCFFLFCGCRNSHEPSRFLAFFALTPAFWCTMRMVLEYRDLTRFLNKSLYVGQFLFVISALVFFLYQAEILLGEENLSRPNAYVFSGLSVVFLGLVARLPELIAIMDSRIRIDLFTSTSLLADLTLTVFVASKLISTTKTN